MTIDLSRFLCDNSFDSGHPLCDKPSVGLHIKNLDTQAEVVVSDFDEYVSLPWLQKNYTDFDRFSSFVSLAFTHLIIIDDGVGLPKKQRMIGGPVTTSCWLFLFLLRSSSSLHDHRWKRMFLRRDDDFDEGAGGGG
jgi:hypothetical protein